MRLRGLDASSVQGRLPVGKLGDYKFAILKGQQGNDGFDPEFEPNMRACLDVGIEVFVYVFAYPLHAKHGGDGRDPREQAALCWERISKFPEMVGRPIFVDLEWPEFQDWVKFGVTAESIAEWCRDFCDELSRLSGRNVVIYTYPFWWKCVSAADVSWAAGYYLWLAAYLNRWPLDSENPHVPHPWSDWKFWQCDGNGGLLLPNGVDADFCIFNGSEGDLEAFIRGPSRELPDAPTIHPPVPLP